MIDDNNPSVYLIGEPSKEGKILTEQADRHDGHWVPFWMFAEVAIRLHAAWSWISGTDALFKRIRRWGYVAITAAGANLGVLAHRWIDRHDASIVAAQRADDDARAFQDYRDNVRLQFEQLHRELDEVRRALLHIGVQVPAARLPGPGSDVWQLPDALSLIDTKGPSCLLVHVTR